MWLKRVCAAGIGCLFFVIGILYNGMKVGDERSTCVVPTSSFSKKKNYCREYSFINYLILYAKRNESRSTNKVSCL